MIAKLAASSNFEPGDNLFIDGIPPIPDAIVEDARPYNDFTTALIASWHPTQHTMLVLTRTKETPQVYSVGTPRGELTELTDFPDRVVQAVYEPTHGGYFVLSKDQGGGEWYQNYRFDVATQEVTLLTDGHSKNSLGVWSHNHDRMAYGSTRRNGKDIDFYVIDPLHPTTSNRLVIELHQGEAWSVQDWSRDDRMLLAIETISINESNLWLIDVDSGEKKLLTPNTTSEPISYRKAKFTDQATITVITDHSSEFLRLATMDIAGNLSFPFSLENWDVENFEVSPDGLWLAYVVNQAGSSVLHIMSLVERTSHVIDLPRGVISDICWHADSSCVAFNLSVATAPSDVFSVDVATKMVARWTTSKTGAIDASNFAEPKVIEWKSFDGKMIPGFLYQPPKTFTGTRPVMVVIHGGPESQARPGYLAHHNYFIEKLGVALIFPNIRGSSGYGKKYLQLDNGYRRGDSYRDIDALFDWIKAHPELDEERVLVTGASYGGHVTLAVATDYNDKIACSIDVVGISNLVTFLERTESYRRDLRRAEYGDERDPAMREFLLSIAPLTKAHNIQKPLFVIQGQNDPRVPTSESLQIVAKAKENGIPVWYLAANDEGHGFVKKANRDFQLFATILFMREYLLGKD